jgi:hypothetical protein
MEVLKYSGWYKHYDYVIIPTLIIALRKSTRYYGYKGFGIKFLWLKIQVEVIFLIEIK